MLVVILWIADYQLSAKIKNINLDLELQQGLEIFFDVDIMKSILRNLLINAVKFSHEDSVVKLTLHQDGDWAVVEVIDSGIGMSAPAQEQLQKQIFRHDAVTAMGEKGTGMGLWVVSHFIHAHQGEFFFESEENVGSRFGFKVKLSTGDLSV